MKTQSILATALLFTCLAAPALARDRVIINQANPLDETMRFYMHPAHLYLISEAPQHPAVLVKRAEGQVQNAAVLTSRPHQAPLGRGAKAKVARSQVGPIYP